LSSSSAVFGFLGPFGADFGVAFCAPRAGLLRAGPLRVRL